MTEVAELEQLNTAEAHRRQLRAAITEISTAAAALESATSAELEQISQRVESDAFRVMVVGEFKRGKSTLVNALLGEDVLPSFARPCTAVVTEVSWDEAPAATLHPSDGSDPVTVPVEEMEDRITIASGAERGTAESSPWRLAQLGWPLSLCENGVIVIDSPGLNEHPVRQEVTLNYLLHADAIVFVQDCNMAVSMEETKFMRRHLESYDVFFVYNKINQIDPDEVEVTKADIIHRMGAARDSRNHSDQHFFVDARAGVKARMTRSEELWAESGMKRFVDSLARYLLTERHKAKTLVTARDLRRILRDLDQRLPDVRALIEQDAGELQSRYEASQGPLAQMEQRAVQIELEIARRTERLRDDIEYVVADRLKALSDEVPDIVAETVTVEEISFAPWNIREDATKYVASLVEQAGEVAIERFSIWAEEELQPEIERFLDDLSLHFEAEFRSFTADLQEIREELTGVSSVETAESEHPFKDVLARVQPEGIGDLSGAGTAAAIKHLVKQLTASLAVLALVGTVAAAPIAIAALFLANATVLTLAKNKVYDRIRAELASTMSKAVRDGAHESARDVSRRFLNELDPLFEGLRARVNGQVTELRNQVETALNDLREGESAIAERRAGLERTRVALLSARGTVDDVIDELAAI